MEKRLLRLTWNDNLWEVPSGHPWRREKQGDTNLAFENQYGFGGEEWLFNTFYNIDGYQYGYIRGLEDVALSGIIDEAYLFSINTDTRDRVLVGVIRNAEVLKRDIIPKKVLRIFDRGRVHKIEQLKAVNADYHGINFEELTPNLKFKIEDTSVFDRPILINELKAGNKYNRFKPYKVTESLQALLNECIKHKPFVFLPGTRSASIEGHIRNTKPRTETIIGVHNIITRELEAFLAPEYSIENENLSIERTVFGDNIADAVLKHADGSFTVIEIKTSNNPRYNIREALGQLIDYSCWHDDVIIKELIIISPSALAEDHKNYFSRIQSTVNTKLKYWQYKSADHTTSSFIQYS